MSTKQSDDQNKVAKANSARIYLDYNATAPVRPEALKAMLQVFDEDYGNASSIHQDGQRSKALIENCRQDIATWVDCQPQQIVFTSGGSEGNATVFRGLFELYSGHKSNHLLVSPLEHSSVLEYCRWIARKGWQVDYLPIQPNGIIVEDWTNLIREDTRLVCVMAANNETGIIQPLNYLSQFSKPSHLCLFSDAAQALGKLDFSCSQSGFDCYSFTGHKIGAPLGIGFMVIAEDFNLPPLMLGGDQERGRRAGTEPVYLIKGLHEALRIAMAERQANIDRWQSLKKIFYKQVAGIKGFFKTISDDAPTLSNTLSFGFEGVDAAELLIALDLRGFSISAGSACQSGAPQPSHVLKAMHLPLSKLKSALRISMGYNTSAADINSIASALEIEVLRLQKLNNTN